ncbi:MAG: N-acetylglucosamine-6-phosphate deacetylase [Lentisphaerae bacterium]|nr:N-acetylglucosamine-6-phosphate deacetylase [Lentisphaerota bacterium]
MKHIGFIDLQINGFKGVDFSAPDLSLEQVRFVTQELLKAGTVAYCPTVVTGVPDNIRHSLATLAQARHDPELKPHLMGIHMEGPFISPVEGARGAHPPDYILKPDVATFQRFQEWAEGQIILLTLAPEVPGAQALIRYASRSGIIVALGHHHAEDNLLAEAVENGAEVCTHLGNGLPILINRHQNPLWWQLTCDELHATFITDGHHLPADFIKVALRCKNVARFIVVSDATHLAGLPPGDYDFHGQQVTLAPNGRIAFRDTPYLAGSSATMLDCMNHLAALKLLTEVELRKVGFANPLRLLGRHLSQQLSQEPRLIFKNNRFALA